MESLNKGKGKESSMVFYNAVDMYKCIIWPWMLSSEVLDMIPLYKKLKNISIQISDEVGIKTNGFLNLVRFNPQSFKRVMH